MKKVTLIKVDGEETEHDFKNLSCSKLKELAGCDVFDTVNLRDGRIMMVDDLGFVEKKPVNQKATALYHSVCVPGTTHPICGDVVITNDADW